MNKRELSIAMCSQVLGVALEEKLERLVKCCL